MSDTKDFLELVNNELGRLHQILFLVSCSDEDRKWAKEQIKLITENMFVRKIFLPAGCEIV